MASEVEAVIEAAKPVQEVPTGGSSTRLTCIDARGTEEFLPVVGFASRAIAVVSISNH